MLADNCAFQHDSRARNACGFDKNQIAAYSGAHD
jgi:hypothetical protein